MSKSINIFSTRSDLASVVTAVELRHPLEYAVAGMFDEPPSTLKGSITDLEDFGIANSSDQNHNHCYLAYPCGTTLVVRPVPQRKGGTKYAVDQLENPQSVSIVPGGVFDNSCVIAGQIGTTSNDALSLELANLFAREVRKQFSRIRSYYVGPDAERLMDQGYRLTADARRSLDYDLAR